MPTIEEMRGTVEQYLELVGGGTAEQIAALYTDDATLEDPVGTEPKVGRDGILEFYKVIEPIKRETELVSFRAAGDVAVFEFRIVTHFDAMTIELNPLDVMEFAEDGRVRRMRALWGPQDMVRRDA
jgi:steroid delta-isomerase